MNGGLVVVECLSSVLNGFHTSLRKNNALHINTNVLFIVYLLNTHSIKFIEYIVYMVSKKNVYKIQHCSHIPTPSIEYIQWHSKYFEYSFNLSSNRCEYSLQMFIRTN